jgi:[ribosomal protein S5]-alanine N-acetyltransferase
LRSLSEPFYTRRLVFRLLCETDLDVVHRQFSDPEMCTYFSEPPMDRDQAAQTIAFFKDPDHDPYLRYGIFHQDSGEFIGTIGYHHLDAELRQAELGYDIWREHWRNGYASEALEVMIHLCFAVLTVERLYVLVHRDNIGSISTARRVGFELSEPCRPLDEPDQVCMKLNRTDWDNDVPSLYRFTITNGDRINGL